MTLCWRDCSALLIVALVACTEPTEPFVVPVGSITVASSVVRAAIVGDSLQLIAQPRTAVGVPMPDVSVT